MRIVRSSLAGCCLPAVIAALGAAAPSPSGEGSLVERLREENARLEARVTELEQARDGSSSELEPVPDSLSALYPPVASAPIYLQRMLDLAGSLDAIAVDAFEGDAENTRGSYDAFVARYQQTATLVPEWQDDFPLQPLTSLGIALNGSEPDDVAAAFERLGAVCRSCHERWMPRVQFRYHWGDIGRVRVLDPVSGQRLPYRRLKIFLSSNLSGVSVDLGQGQRKRAVAQMQALRARFDALAETCGVCHASERADYVDASIRRKLDDLAAELGKEVIERDRIASLTRAIGEESCYRCHLVHMPAALARSSASGR